MSVPETTEGLCKRGYRFDNHAKCPDCRQEIEWWITPSGKRIMLNLMTKPNARVSVHFETCNVRNGSLFGRQERNG